MTGQFMDTVDYSEDRSTIRNDFNIYATTSTVSVYNHSSPSQISLGGHQRDKSGDFNLREAHKPLVTPVTIVGGQNRFDIFNDDCDGSSVVGATSPVYAN